MSNLEFSRTQLQKAITEGTSRAAGTIERIFREVPEDAIVRAPAFGFAVHRGELDIALPDGRSFGTHANAYRQIVERAGVPKAYADSLIDTPDEWRRELLRDILARHYAHDDKRYLVRSVGAEVRGVLSDKFRRLDSRPLLEQFAIAATELGAVPYEGTGSVIKSEVRFILPELYEPTPGEALTFGVTWRNSDYGAGLFDLSAFYLRLWCLNGAVGASEMKQVHLGGRLSEDLEFSQRTYELDTKAMISATKDVVRGALSLGAIEKHVAVVRAAAEQGGDFGTLSRKIAKSLSKAEVKSIKDAFEGPDVVNLPAGNTMWRMSNALSWVANATESQERKLELQAMAGAVLA